MQGDDKASAGARTGRAGVVIGFVVALILLNGALTFQNLWPTFWPRPSADLSLEVAILVLFLALLAEWRPLRGRAVRALLSALLALLVLGRYVDVTAGGLFGRPLDLYWDLPHLPNVVAMAAASQPIWSLVLAGLALAVLLTGVVVGLAWIVRGLCRGLAERRPRRFAALSAAGLLAAYGAGLASESLRSEWWFAFPVTPVYARQGGKLIKELAADPATDSRADFAVAPSDLGRLERADVFLIFLESYGATLFEQPAHAETFRASLDRLAADLDQAGWSAASALLTSPTFGGASWLAHASVFAGSPISDQGVYQSFLRSRSETLISRFRSAGYRTVALMPGIKRAWPEGAGLGFDRIYAGGQLGYRGTPYGWWAIPDQFSLERLHGLEVAAPERPPLFVFFPTVMSHMPFQPTPPYLADWSRVGDGGAYSSQEIQVSVSQLQHPRVMQAYLDSVDYDLAVIGGFLRQRVPRDALVVVTGDHQPPALVSGAEASWHVPVHILSRDPDRLAPFHARGFRAGLVPDAAALGGLEALTRLLLEGFDSGAVCDDAREACS